MLTQQDKADRAIIAALWRQMNGQPDSTDLAMTPAEWAFMLALLRRPYP